MKLHQAAVDETVDFVKDLLVIPPGFERGMEFADDKMGELDEEAGNVQVGAWGWGSWEGGEELHTIKGKRRIT